MKLCSKIDTKHNQKTVFIPEKSLTFCWITFYVYYVTVSLVLKFIFQMKDFVFRQSYSYSNFSYRKLILDIK